MATRRSLSPARTLLALCTAAVTGVALVPGVANAEPRPTIASVESRLAALERQAASAAENYHEATDAAAAVEERLAAVRTQIAAAQARFADLQGTVGRLANESYRAGGMDPTLRVLLAEDPQDFLAQIASVDRLSEHQGVVIRKVTAVQAELAEDRTTVRQELERREQVQARLRTEKASLDEKVAASAALLRNLREEERRRLEAARRAAEERALAQARAARDAAREAARAAAAPAGAATTASAGESTDDGGSAGRDAASDGDSADRGSREAQRSTDGGSSGSSSADAGGGTYSGPASGRAAIAVETALAQVGDRYVYGGNGPDVFDCSGLTTYAWRAAGVSLPRSSTQQYAAGRKVAKSDLQPGDLVYYYSPISHVAMYIGNGQIVHAANPRKPVYISSVDIMPYAGATRP